MHTREKNVSIHTVGRGKSHDWGGPLESRAWELFYIVLYDLLWQFRVYYCLINVPVCLGYVFSTAVILWVDMANSENMFVRPYLWNWVVNGLTWSDHFLQMSELGAGCLPAVPPEPWRLQLPSPQMWSKWDSRLRPTLPVLRGTREQWKPTEPLLRKKACAASGKVCWAPLFPRWMLGVGCFSERTMLRNDYHYQREPSWLLSDGISKRHRTKSTHRSQEAKLEILPVHLRLNLRGDKFELHKQNQTSSATPPPSFCC